MDLKAEVALDFQGIIANADGHITDEEKSFYISFYERLQKNIDIEVVKKRLQEPRPVDQVFNDFKKLDRVDQLEILRDSFVMANIDGNLHESELGFLENALISIGVNPQKKEKIREYLNLTLELAKIEGELGTLRQDLFNK